MHPAQVLLFCVGYALQLAAALGAPSEVLASVAYAGAWVSLAGLAVELLDG